MHLAQLIPASKVTPAKRFRPKSFAATAFEALETGLSFEAMKKIYERFTKIEPFIAAFGFIVMLLVIFVAAIMRKIGMPLNWSWDISLFLFAWSVFLAADSAMRHNKLISVDFVVNLFSPTWKTWATIATYSIIVVFLLSLAGFGFYLSYFTRVRVFEGIPHFSYTWVTLSVPVGAVLQIITIAIKIRSLAHKTHAAERRPSNSGEQGEHP